MSKSEFDDECTGCKPVILDTRTGLVEPEDSFMMKVVNSAWNASSPEDRAAFHRFTCLNSRDPEDLSRVQDLSERIRAGASS